MSRQKKKIVFLCLLLVISGGWIALASRQTVQPAVGGSGTGTPNAMDRVWEPDAGVARTPSVIGADRDAAPQTQPSTDYRLPATRLEGLGNGELFFRMMLSVGLILGLGAAALYLSRRVLPRVTHTPGKEIQVLETAHLGPRKAIHLVEVGGRRLLLASTTDSITMLAAVPETWSDLSGQELSEAVQA